MKDSYILAIDTSCDDTSVAVLKNDCVLSSIVSSQIDVHREWGGIVPSLARREHEKMIEGCVATALKRSGLKTADRLTVIAVTYGPGLAPALEVGVRHAKQLAQEYHLPLIAVDHMEGHALSALLKNSSGKTYSGIEEVAFPLMALCVSGGHTELILSEKFGAYSIIGQTLDDAAGEAFDKIARMLDLGYPGAQVLAKFAETGDPMKYPLPRPMKNSDNYHFSFSGLKTACLYNTNTLKAELGDSFASIIPDYCASVEEAIVDVLVYKTVKAVKEYQPKMFLLGGGVSANKTLRARLRSAMKELGVPTFFPAPQFSTDNAAMIGYAGYQKLLRGEVVSDIEALQRDPSITIDKMQY